MPSAPKDCVVDMSLATLDERTRRQVVATIADPTAFATLQRQGDQCGWCSHPIRLIGHSTRVDTLTGEVLASFSSLDQPGAMLMKACGTRRASRCQSCAALYASDARQLVRAGLLGGKGVSEDVATHPMVFATFTAPGFGAVHSTRGGRVCHQTNGERTCRHGQSTRCLRQHRSGDALLGTPLCPDCYDYEGSVLWNATCPELWRRTTIYVRRELARTLGLTVKQFSATTRLSFARVAEFQRRGVVHLHAILRLDPLDQRPLALDVNDLTSALRSAATKVWAPIERDVSEQPASAKWGHQLDVRTVNVDLNNTSGTSARAIANYLAKYATKSADELGVLDQRLTGLDDLKTRDVSDHVARLVATAWRLGASPQLQRLRHWAHSLGFGGHWLTKSRAYSVTFKKLRAERQAWRVQRHQGVNQEHSITIGVWNWVGTGWRTLGDAWFALERQRTTLRSRIEARDARCIKKQRALEHWIDPSHWEHDLEAVEP